MVCVKRIVAHASVAALIGAGSMAAMAGSASAYVHCNNSGDCWHTHFQYTYDSNLGVTSHPDDWYFHQTWTGSDRHYRDYHEGRGGYRNGVWFSF